MAAVLIEFTGTGLLQLNWLEGDTPRSLRTGGGIIYLDDTATDVTYTTLTGNIVADATDALPFTYYKIGWRDIQATSHSIIGVKFNSDSTIEIDSIDFPNSGVDLVRSVNAGVDDRFKIVAYRRISTQIDYIVKTIGGTSISFVVQNDDNELMYMVGEPFDIGDITPDYKEVSECYPSENIN